MAITSAYGVQTVAAPASTAGLARTPVVNPAVLQANVRSIPTPLLVYLGDYATLAPMSSGPLLYNGDYAPLAPQVTGVLVYQGSGSADLASLPAFMVPKQIATGVLTYTGDYPPMRATPMSMK